MTHDALPEVTRGRLLGGAPAALAGGGLLAACGSNAAPDKARVGILSAVAGEQTGLLSELGGRKTIRRGGSFRPPLVQPFVGAGVPTDPVLRRQSAAAAREFLGKDLAQDVSASTRRSQGIEHPKVVIGTIVSTNTLNSTTCEHRLLELVPDPGCLDTKAAP
jgi:hypothetical protein